MKKVNKNICLILFLIVFNSCSTKKPIGNDESIQIDTIHKNESLDSNSLKEIGRLDEKYSNEDNKIDHVQFLKTIYPYPSEGTSILDLGKGDLNGDSLDDYVILWKRLDENYCDCDKYGIDGCLNCCPSRIVSILLHRPANEDTLVPRSLEDYLGGEANENILYKKCSNPDGDPINKLEVGNGYFLIGQSINGIDKMNRTIKFELNKTSNKLELVQDDIFYFGNNGRTHEDEGTRTQKDFGVITFEEFNIHPKK